MNNKVYLVTEYYHESQNTTGYLLGKVYNFLNMQSDIDLVLIAKEDKNSPCYSNAHYIKAISPNKTSLLKRLIYEFMISFYFFVSIMKNVEKKSIVFTGTTPIFLLIVLFFTKKFLKFKWILLVHDVFPENLVAAKVLKQESMVYKILKRFFDVIYTSADEVIVIGKDMEKLVHSKTHKNNISVIQNWIDYSDINVEPKNDNSILKELNWLDMHTTIFQFFGNIGRVQGVDVILDAIKNMEYSHLAKFIFIGDGAYVEKLKIQIKSLNLDNVFYYGALDQSQKSIGLNACDVALVTLAEGMLGLGVPSKSYFSMAANKPILAIMEHESEVSHMLKTHNIGWVVQPNNIHALTNKLDEIVQKNNVYGFNSPREVLKKYYAEPVAMQNILEIIRKLN